jgi:hypothetical protein
MENRKVRDANVWRVFKPMGIMRWFRKMLEREREREREGEREKCSGLSLQTVFARLKPTRSSGRPDSWASLQPPAPRLRVSDSQVWPID